MEDFSKTQTPGAHLATHDPKEGDLTPKEGSAADMNAAKPLVSWRNEETLGRPNRSSSRSGQE
ncbi:hypothetical protein [Erythrobacter litoralis]|uniref:Uncharacterized protein n=1 Tax=Erythrobacter litoralis (strain HTCC2594) TaxID=314225 RepID=Q2NDC8_ERYLH|nr:hypothetical protein [Erythrobacter litoralis]ABC62313.1 hypothetical protein ELI_01105 [Erythrobacter litoralis HTCC2594]